jgi:hypothetical protein
LASTVGYEGQVARDGALGGRGKVIVLAVKPWKGNNINWIVELAI